MTDVAHSPVVTSEVRKQAADVMNLNHLVPDRRDTAGVPPDLVEAVNALGDRYGPTDWSTTSDERMRVMATWCSLIPLLGLVPAHHDPNATDWHWSGVRCILAGAGYEAHAALATQLSLLYPQCPLLPTETLDEWMKNLREAHQQSGIPAGLLHIPWSQFASLPDQDADALEVMGTTWIVAAALAHMLKHVRVYQDEIRVLYRGSVRYYRRPFDSNTLDSNPRFMAALISDLRMARIDRRNNEHAVAAWGASRAVKYITIDRFLHAEPLSSLPGAILAGPFTRLVPNPDCEGWFQHGLTLHNAWSASNGTTRVFTGNDDVVLSYGWAIERPDASQQHAYDLITDAIPKTYTIDTPFAILTQYQPNFVFDWCKDVEAYASIIDSVLLMALMRDRVPGSRREFPLVWLLPDDPTPEGSTNQGKTSAVTALAGCMTPGILISRPADTNSAPDLRVVAGAIRSMGTVALDEWTLPKNQAHPLASRNLQTMATGNAIGMGEVLENNPTPVMLRQPIVASAKCLLLPEDIRNRSVFLFMRGLSGEERAHVNRHDAILRGEVAVRMRLAGLDLIRQHGLDQLTPRASEAFRFTYHLALAERLYALRTGKNEPQAVVRAADAMHHHYHKQFARADESGVLSESESGETLSVRASTIFGTMTPTEMQTMYDMAVDIDPARRLTAGQILRLRQKCGGQDRSLHDLLGDLIGYRPRASVRALTMAFSRDLRRLMPLNDEVWVLPDMLGYDGWQLKREPDAAGGVRVALMNTHPSR